MSISYRKLDINLSADKETVLVRITVKEIGE